MASQPPRVPNPQQNWDNAAADKHGRDRLQVGQPADTSFKTFGILPETHQSKGSTFVSITINVLLALVAIVLSTQAAKIVAKKNQVDISRLVPLKKEDLPKPKPVIKELPKPPKIKPVEPPKINVPKIEVPEPPKIQTPVMQAKPVPIVNPAPPKAVNPPPAPKVINLAKAQAASVANNNPNPSAIRLGSMTNPIHNTSGPAVSPVNLGRAGAPGMPAGNTGLGPASKINIAGSGAPNGKMGGTDNAPHAIVGVKNGVPGGTGALTNKPTGAIQIARNNEVARPTTVPPPSGGATTPPKVLYKPKPEYTAEARQMHLEGNISVRIHVSASGAVQVLGISGSGLGHGLNEAAIRAVQAMRFQPATRNGQPVDWEGTVNISFQLA